MSIEQKPLMDIFMPKAKIKWLKVIFSILLIILKVKDYS